MHRAGFYEKYVKRLLDIFCAGLTLVVLLPVMLAVALLVRSKLGSPVIFCQERPGRNEKIFRLYKFRSMADLRDESGRLLPDSERLTPFGKKLRASSLDELPELWNIVRGDMSIVGPRPLLVKYLPLYNQRQRRRHDVRPGLTGLAQCSGRNALPWDEKLEYDVVYTETISFALDMRIIWRTVGKVTGREGISGENSDTMEEFTGTGGTHV